MFWEQCWKLNINGSQNAKQFSVERYTAADLDCLAAEIELRKV